MEWFDSVRSVFPIGSDGLTEEDLIEMRKEYEGALEICDYIIKWADHYQRTSAEEFVTGDDDFITYEHDTGNLESVDQFPDEIQSVAEKVLVEFDPRKQAKSSDVEQCFEEHKKFAERTKETVNDVLDELEDLDEKMKRVEYMKEAEEEFEFEGFENPTASVSTELSEYFRERVEESNDTNGSSDGDDGIKKMSINQLVYFIAEELRRTRDMEHDTELHGNLYSAYPEQSDLVSEKLIGSREKYAVENLLRDLGGDENLPPLKQKHIKFYIIPRVFEGVPSKTPEEIGML